MPRWHIIDTIASTRQACYWNQRSLLTSNYICWNLLKFPEIYSNFRKFQQISGSNRFPCWRRTPNNDKPVVNYVSWQPSLMYNMHAMCTLTIKHMSWLFVVDGTEHKARTIRVPETHWTRRQQHTRTASSPVDSDAVCIMTSKSVAAKLSAIQDMDWLQSLMLTQLEPQARHSSDKPSAQSQTMCMIA